MPGTGLSERFDGDFLVSLLLGSLPGVMIGSLLAPRLLEIALRLTLARVLIAVAAKMLV
jgi:hypothetical protein